MVLFIILIACLFVVIDWNNFLRLLRELIALVIYVIRAMLPGILPTGINLHWRLNQLSLYKYEEFFLNSHAE